MLHFDSKKPPSPLYLSALGDFRPKSVSACSMLKNFLFFKIQAILLVSMNINILFLQKLSKSIDIHCTFEVDLTIIS